MDPNHSQKNPGGHSGIRLPLAPKTLIGFLLAIVAVAAIAVLSYQSLQTASISARNLAQSIEVLAQIEGLLSTLKDAETGQRGFLLTNDESYLEPYALAQAALPTEISRLKALLAERPEQSHRLEDLESLAKQKMAELQSTVERRRAGNPEGALAIVRNASGKLYMDRIRSVAAEMAAAERQAINQRARESNNAAAVALEVTWGGSALLFVLIGVSALSASRDYLAAKDLAWIQAGQMGLSERMQGDQALERLAHNLLEYLAPYLMAQVGAVYIAQGGQFRRVAGYALGARASLDTVKPGDGLLGQAVRSNRVTQIRDVPADYLQIESATGSGSPSELLIVPASIDGLAQAVIEFGFFGTTLTRQRELLARAAESIAVAVRASKDRQRLEELLHETQQQSEELQAGAEELRVSNEELEEQGRALRESQGHLERQQAELEQANAQLEEQTQLLEHQKESLAQAHDTLQARSDDLQRSNEYKSEFLANMSHELRTPLNSTLILAKLLADNKEGNLTPQQVKFAQTISSAGNDLLDLINDVLDLSRIEAGKVELRVERVAIASTVDSLLKAFQPVADQKHVALTTAIEPTVPEFIESDAQRLGQILKNLLSNAFKFTQAGEVGLRVSMGAGSTLAFAVSDTGVGIAPHQQEVIFEAFRQADGSIHRKYGGTGLGLSISRDLATLLGGTIAVQSALGKGSVFILTVPLRHVPAVVPEPERPPPPALPPIGMPAFKAPSTANISFPLQKAEATAPNGAERTILAVEDDEAFAMIVKDLCLEMGFRCIVATTAREALAAAHQHQPSAVVLDINLPDFSGLSVLDQLKHDPATRHIPVHVISALDYKREALSRGAVGYMLKPARREQLVDALRQLETKLAQSVRNVLVVEDDPRQRESIRQLLSNGDVQITAVATAGEALAHLKSNTVDCMVVDFNLPDLSGYDLLEKMAAQDEVSFPPVIVYTGRALSTEEEQRLMRFSSSIIIKDARSPERLLDEVTLFLHQVESKLPPERQQMLKTVRNRDAQLEGRRILVAEDDVRNIFALSSVLEPNGVKVVIARNGREAIDVLAGAQPGAPIDLVLMDIMMPEMDGLSAMREIRQSPQWRNLPIIALTAKAMADDQEKCLAAGASDYIAKPLDVEKLLSLVRVWMPK
jgi:CheY-like chemotaxis protein/CHASE3 domain sensor protein